MIDNPFFSNRGITNIPQDYNAKRKAKALSRQSLIFETIKQKAPISTYRLSKILNLPYTSTYFFVSKLIASGLVNYNIQVADNQRLVKMLVVADSNFSGVELHARPERVGEENNG